MSVCMYVQHAAGIPFINTSNEFISICLLTEFFLLLLTKSVY